MQMSAFSTSLPHFPSPVCHLVWGGLGIQRRTKGFHCLNDSVVPFIRQKDSFFFLPVARNNVFLRAGPYLYLSLHINLCSNKCVEYGEVQVLF